MGGRGRQAGGRPVLTPLEEEVMQAIWDCMPGPVCVRDVLDRVNSGRAKPLAYNTIQTVFVILRDKKAIKQAKKQGRAHYFQPTYSREQATRRSLIELAQRMFGGRVKPLLHQMIDDAQLSTEDLQQLRQWADEKLKDKKPPSKRTNSKRNSKRSSS